MADSAAGAPGGTDDADDAGARARQALSFGAVAGTYARVRPTYPAAALDWLLPAGARRAADVGAGTGLMTARLLERGLDVVAVEPDPGMRAQLLAGLPGADCRAGSGEELPLPDGSVDVVVAAQAWHWVDADRAAAEAARVLVPGGRLALVWNVRDESVPWVAELGRLLHRSAAEQAVVDGPRVPPPFGPLEAHEVAWVQELSPDDLVDLAASRSYVATAPPERARAVLDGVRELLATHPATAGRDRLQLPYTTRCWRADLPPAPAG